MPDELGPWPEDLTGSAVASAAPPVGGGPREPGPLSLLLKKLAEGPDEDVAGAWRRGLEPGESVGRYQIRREIGRGGFGAVYEAHDPELGRQVALKTLRPGRSRRELAAEWIQREAAAARFDHPCIVTVFDQGTCASGPYLVMELLRGETLAERLRRGPLPAGQALGVAEEMARGLAHAHRRGTLHRDLKPANVFLCEDGRVKLLDFGLAHLLGTPGSKVAGTPGYMAPEQERGEEVDERADVYAAGVVLGEMVGEEAAPRPLARAVEAATWPEAERRPRDGGAWLGALQAARRGLELPRALRRVALLGAAGAVLGLLAVVGYLWYAGVRPNPVGRITVAVADMVNETRDPDLDGLSGMLVTALQESPKLRVLTRGRLLSELRKLGRGEIERVDETLARDLGTRLGADALLLATIRRSGEGFAGELRAIEPAADEYLFAVGGRAPGKAQVLAMVNRLAAGARDRLLRGAAGGDARPVADLVTPSLEAYRHYAAGMSLLDRGEPGSRAEFLKAIALQPDFALAHYALLDALADGLTPVAELRSAAAEALQVADRAPWRERLLIRAANEKAAGRAREAAALLGQILEREPDDLEALAQLGTLLPAAEALAPCRRALSIDRAHAGARVCLLQSLTVLGRREELLALGREWAGRSTEGPVHTTALALAAGGAAGEALAVARRGADLGPGGQTALVRVLEWSGEYREMEAVARRRVDATGHGFAPLARALLYLGRRREALEAVDRAWAARAGTGFITAQQAFLLAAGDGPGPSLRARALEQLELDPRTREMVVLTLAVAGDGEAARELEAPLPPDSRVRRLVEARLALAAGDPERARAQAEAYTDAAQVQELDDRPGFLLLGEACLAAGDPDGAIAALERYRLPTLYPFTIRPWALQRAGLLVARARMLRSEVDLARRELDGLLAGWRDADAGYPPLLEARALRRGLAGGGVRPRPARARP